MLFPIIDGNIFVFVERKGGCRILCRISNLLKKGPPGSRADGAELPREERRENLIRRFKEALQSGDGESAREKLKAAIRQIDKAAARGVIHKNNAARRKSRLTRLFNTSVTG